MKIRPMICVLNVLKVMIFQVQFISSRNEEVNFKWAAFFCSIFSIPFFKFLEKINSGQSKNFFLYKFYTIYVWIVKERKGKGKKRKEVQT